MANSLSTVNLENIRTRIKKYNQYLNVKISQSSKKRKILCRKHYHNKLILLMVLIRCSNPRGKMKLDWRNFVFIGFLQESKHTSKLAVVECTSSVARPVCQCGCGVSGRCPTPNFLNVSNNQVAHIHCLGKACVLGHHKCCDWLTVTSLPCIFGYGRLIGEVLCACIVMLFQQGLSACASSSDVHLTTGAWYFVDCFSIDRGSLTVVRRPRQARTQGLPAFFNVACRKIGKAWSIMRCNDDVWTLHVWDVVLKSPPILN